MWHSGYITLGGGGVSPIKLILREFNLKVAVCINHRLSALPRSARSVATAYIWRVHLPRGGKAFTTGKYAPRGPFSTVVNGPRVYISLGPFSI